MYQENKYGFTIVELLIVIVVIGILAVITIVAFGTIQDRAQASKINADVSSLAKAMNAAKVNTGDNLLVVTAALGAQNNGAGRGCWSKASGTDLATLVKTDSCWTDYFSALQILSDASGINVTKLLDPWGRPYYIDQNEGENIGGNLCVQDKASVYQLPHVTGAANDNASYRRLVPNTTSGC